MFPNDKTDVNNNLALSTDYSVQLKDDGKALYGWGTIHKRPNDVRLYASLPLPDGMEGPGATTSSLPKPSWSSATTSPTTRTTRYARRTSRTRPPRDASLPTGSRARSGCLTRCGSPPRSCYEGDSDLIDTEIGNVDPTFFGVGTIFKNTMPFASAPTRRPTDDRISLPAVLGPAGGITNAWYTTVDRGPFEWSYDTDGDPTTCRTLSAAGWRIRASVGDLVSGPRWRLRPNKYGQDLPGLEVAIEPSTGGGTDGADCYAPPFESALIKYPVGEPTITEINLLDWESATTSPLQFSSGWVDVTQNGVLKLAGTNNWSCPTRPTACPCRMTSTSPIYIKGDRKPTAVYDAYLEIDYDVAYRPTSG